MATPRKQKKLKHITIFDGDGPQEEPTPLFRARDVLAVMDPISDVKPPKGAKRKSRSLSRRRSSTSVGWQPANRSCSPKISCGQEAEEGFAQQTIRSMPTYNDLPLAAASLNPEEAALYELQNCFFALKLKAASNIKVDGCRPAKIKKFDAVKS